jgi:mycofactocin system transcriptional regulator
VSSPVDASEPSELSDFSEVPQAPEAPEGSRASEDPQAPRASRDPQAPAASEPVRPARPARPPEPPSHGHMGRQPSTSVAELSHVALRLFAERGFAETTVDDIATACGISRRTFFRYFASKNDLPWGDFEALVEQMRGRLLATPPQVPLVEALREAIVAFNRFPPEAMEDHRLRMSLLLNVPALVAHSTLRYATWRQAIAEFAARRLGVAEDAMQPQVVAWAALAASLSAYEQWLKHEGADLPGLLRTAFDVLGSTFSGREFHDV